MAAEQATLLTIRAPIIVFGHALFYAWYLTVACVLSVSYPAEGLSYLAGYSQFALLLSTAIATVVLSRGVPSNFFGRSRYALGTSISALAMGALPCLLAALDIQRSGMQPVFTALLFLAGISVVYFFSSWEDMAMECGPVNPILSTAAAFTIGTGLFAVTAFFPLHQTAILALLYLVLSTALLVIVGRSIHKEEVGEEELPDEAAEPEGSPRAEGVWGQFKTSLLFFLISFCSGLVLALCSSLSQTLLIESFFAGIILCCAAIALFWMTKSNFSINTLMMLDAAVITISLILAIAWGSETMNALAACAVLAAWTLFRAFNCGLVMSHSVTHGQPSVRNNAASNTSINIGLPLGCLAACLMIRCGIGADAFRMVFTALAILLVIFCFIVRPLGIEKEGAGHDTAGSNSFEELARKCMTVAEEYHLSPREGEILCYLARGRSAKRIADDLVLSEHTVKSHAYRIYRKVGVHTRQELIDLVEANAPLRFNR